LAFYQGAVLPIEAAERPRDHVLPGVVEAVCRDGLGLAIWLYNEVGWVGALWALIFAVWNAVPLAKKGLRSRGFVVGSVGLAQMALQGQAGTDQTV
jgi:hypothetical protein